MTILHICADWPDTGADLDNIVKPILDALSGTVFFNDNQVKELVVRRTDLEAQAIATIEGATPLLAANIEAFLRTPEERSPFIYVRIRTSIDHGTLE